MESGWPCVFSLLRAVAVSSRVEEEEEEVSREEEEVVVVEK